MVKGKNFQPTIESIEISLQSNRSHTLEKAFSQRGEFQLVKILTVVTDLFTVHTNMILP